MHLLTRTLLGIFTALHFSCYAIADDLCVDSGLASISPRNDCRTKNIKLIDGSSEYFVEMAQAFKEERRDIDVFHQVDHFALRLSNGEIVYLGEFKPWVTSLFWPIWSEALGMTKVYSATASISGDEIYEKLLLKQGHSFCALYRMKKPFIGEIKDCTGDYSAHVNVFVHNVRMLPDVIVPSQAWLAACKAFLDGRTEFCKDYVNHSATIIRRTADGKLDYVVELSNYFNETKTARNSRPNYLVYVIDPEMKSIRLISTNENSSGHQQLIGVSRL